MRMRGFVGRGLVAGLAAGLFAFAAASDGAAQDRVRWKMASWFPSGLTQLGTLGKRFVENLEEISGGDIRVRYYEPGALVPPQECFDAVSAGSVDACWSTTGYWFGKEPALAMFTAVPFGPRAGEYMAWYYFGGGRELMDEIYAGYNLKSMMCGIIAPEASGWFSKEIKSLDDLKGLKMRFFGLGAKVMEKVGVSTQLIAGADIYPALERGSIDATEYSMPAIDLDLGFYQVASHYYFPGWHQQATMFEVLMNLEKWDGLSDRTKKMFEVVCGDNVRYGIAEGEYIQFGALQELQDKGVTLHRWPESILDELREAWKEVAADLAAEDENFKKVWASYTEFRENYDIWAKYGYLEQ